MISKLIAEANSLSSAGNFEDAVKLLENFLEDNPGQQDILLLLGNNCFSAGHHYKAGQAFKAYAEASNDPETLRAFGNMLYKNGDTTQATTVYQDYLELRPKNKAVWRRLAALHLAADDVITAIGTYYRVIELEPDNTQAGLELSRMLFSQQRGNEAETIMAGVLKNNPDDPEINCLYASWLARSGKLGEALDYNTRALESAPSNIKYQLRQANILERMGEADKTFDMLKPLLEDKNVPFDAVRIFSRISPALCMKHEAGLLLDYISGRDEITGTEREMIDVIRDWLARS